MSTPTPPHPSATSDETSRPSMEFTLRRPYLREIAQRFPDLDRVQTIARGDVLSLTAPGKRTMP